jgi:nucleoside-diphosphate-sugar epimerase
MQNRTFGPYLAAINWISSTPPPPPPPSLSPHLLPTQHTYNVTAVSFSPGQLAAAIAEHVPGFTVCYRTDFREAIARSWPSSIDDSAARRDWGWRPAYDLKVIGRWIDGWTDHWMDGRTDRWA